jgi:hypothetical protein
MKQKLNTFYTQDHEVELKTCSCLANPRKQIKDIFAKKLTSDVSLVSRYVTS